MSEQDLAQDLAQNLAASPWWPYVLVIVAGLATYFWRALGVTLSGRIDAGSRLFEWVACVAYAMLAGLIARMILLPNGPLAATAAADRLGAAVVALAIFFLTRRNIGLGVAAGAGALVLISWGRAFF
ncbi:MAG: AzlD domain-containing protein [Kiloniellaceae bacterium]